MSGPIEVMLIIAVVCYVLVRRMAGEPAQAKRMLILPLVLTVIGISDIGKITQSGLAMGFLVVTVALSVVIGALRGASIRLYQRDGIVFMRYTWVTVGLWVLNLAVKFGANVLLGVVDQHAAAASGNTLFCTLGIGLLVEGLVVLSRALRTGHRVIWAKGKDGKPHETAAFLDDLQNRLSGRGDVRRY